MFRHLPSIPTHPLLVVCRLGNSLLRFTPMIQRDLSFYYPDCNKEVCLVIASESLQCITQLIASYYSVSPIVSATSSAKGAFTRRNIRCNMLCNMFHRMLHRMLCNKSPPLTRTERYANLLHATRNNLEQILFC